MICPLSPLFLSLSKVLPVVTCTCIVPPMGQQYIILPKVSHYNFTSASMRLNFTNRLIAKLDILGISITPSLSLLSALLFQSPSITFLTINFIFLLSFCAIIYIFCISFPIFTNAKFLYHSFNINSLLPSRALISASLGLLKVLRHSQSKAAEDLQFLAGSDPDMRGTSVLSRCIKLIGLTFIDLLWVQRATTGHPI